MSKREKEYNEQLLLRMKGSELEQLNLAYKNYLLGQTGKLTTRSEFVRIILRKYFEQM